LRGKAIASPLTTAPTETPRQRRKYAVVRNRRVSTMGVYHRRSQPPRQPSAAPRSAAPPVPCRAHPRFAWACCALPALPRNAKSPQPPKVPRLGFKLPRPVKVPRSASKVPRLGGRNRRAPASKVPRSSASRVSRLKSYPPLRLWPTEPLLVLPRSTLSTLKTLMTLSTRRAPQTATRRPASCHRPWSCPVKVPRRGERFSRPKRGVLAASSLIPVGARIGEARARRKLRRFAGWPCAVLSLSQWIGGDARQRRKTERGNFRVNSFDSELPRSVLGGTSRPRRPRLAECPLRSAKHTSTEDETTLKGDRPRRAQGQIKAQGKHTHCNALGGAGWEIPRAAVGKGKARLNANAAAPRPRATDIQPPSWDEHRTRSWARIEEG